MASGDQPPRIGDLREPSVATVRSALAEGLLELHRSVEPELATLLDHGNEQMATIKRSPTSFNEAMASLAKLVQEMATCAAARRTQVVDVAAFHAALQHLCPLAPWC